MHEKILCVGLYDNDLNLLIKLLLMKRFGINAVQSAGTDRYAHRGLEIKTSVREIATQLGFLICRDPALQKKLNAKSSGTEPIAVVHNQTHITKIRDLSAFDLVITPYESSHRKLLERFDHVLQKVRLIDNIKPDMSIPHAFEIARSWIQKNL